MNILYFRKKKELYRIESNTNEYSHIMNILKLGVGDSVKIGCAEHYLGTGTIERIEKSRIDISADWRKEQQNTHQLPIDVLVGHPRPLVAKRVIKDLTTIGVQGIHFVFGALVEKSYKQSKLWTTDLASRCQHEGIMQSGYPGESKIFIHNSLKAFFSSVNYRDESEQRTMYGTIINGVESSRSVNKSLKLSPPVLVCIGPERGWTNDEDSLINAMNPIEVSFGPRILRTETACTALTLFVGQSLANLC